MSNRLSNVNHYAVEAIDAPRSRLHVIGRLLKCNTMPDPVDVQQAAGLGCLAQPLLPRYSVGGLLLQTDYSSS